MKHTTNTNTTTNTTISLSYGGDQVPPGAFHGGDEVPPGAFHGVIQCHKCKRWFADDTYAWRQHRRTCKG